MSCLLLPVDEANLGRPYGIAMGAALVALLRVLTIFNSDN